MDYAIVIATRNRPAALRLSIPRMLNQSRPPAQLIVIDSSDDHAAASSAVRESVGSHPVGLIIRHREPSSSAQRNLGVSFVEHPVVFFPDDDSIWYPGVAAEVLGVYERDEYRKIAAVCGAEATTPPPDWERPGAEVYQMRRSHRLLQRFAALRVKIENRFVPDPAQVLGRDFWPAVAELPEWFAERNVVPVEWMTGFRMTFRTEVIRRNGFDETLSRYALCEDIDASFSAWRYGLVVGARNAKIFHYKSPERRDGGLRYGGSHILNKAYVVCKHASLGHPARDSVRRSAIYKSLLYRLSSRDSFSRDRYRGARTALGGSARLVTATQAEAGRIYRDESRRFS